MALMLQSAITEEVPKIAELNKGFLFNGNYCLKSDLSPFPFQQYFVRGYNYNGMWARTCTSQYAYYTNKYINKITDSSNANITYVFGYKDTNNITIAKILEDDTGMTILRTNEISHGALGNTGGGYEKILEVFKQDVNYIYFFVSGYNSCVGIARFNKNTLVTDWSYSLNSSNGYAKIKILKTTDNACYFAWTYGWNIYVYKYNITSSTVTSLKTWTIGNNYSSYWYHTDGFGLLDFVQATVPTNDVNYYEEFHFVMRGINQNSSNSYWYHLPTETSFKIWYNQDVVTDNAWRFMMDTSTQAIKDSETVKYGVNYAPSRFNEHYNYHVMTAADGTKTIWLIPLYDQTGVTNSLKCMSRFFMTKKADGFWYMTDVKTLDNTSVIHTNYMFTQDKKTLYIMKYQQPLEVWQWNEVEYMYKQTKTLCGNVQSFGLDDFENLWVIDTVGLHWFSTKDIPVDIVMNTANLSYTYDNADINTYIQVGTKDLNGNYISLKVRLTINGDCYFTDNNSKVIDITTDTAGPINVLITITGKGKCSVTPTFFVN